MEIIDFFIPGSTILDEARIALRACKGKMYVVAAEYSAERKKSSSFAGLDLALKLDTGGNPLIVCTFMPQSFFFKNAILSQKVELILNKPKTTFLSLSELKSPDHWYEIYQKLKAG